MSAPLGELALIERYFRAIGARRADVACGVGDDAALLVPAAGLQLVAALDTLVDGVHFPHGSPPASVGHRALAVNLSDLAAMGADPAWALLGLTLPSADESWIAAFARGFDVLARDHGVALVGGDMTRGPLTVSVQVMGFVPPGEALLRSGGRAGDVLCVTGTAGDAAAGLALEQGRASASGGDAEFLRARFLYPTPRCASGVRLRGFASACIDISDGLAADAGKLAAASGCGVRLELGELPLSAPLVRVFGGERARALALSGGDDYELLFTVPPARLAALERALPAADGGWRRIGELCESMGVFTVDRGVVTQFSHGGYDHFATG
ncbi:MAG TPA: thiamine-phosphate kinase [Steroidobacteraceae bacterium]|nr:thiamine-phosphate kinase [Steroidobacteraceae bacterium]